MTRRSDGLVKGLGVLLALAMTGTASQAVGGGDSSGGAVPTGSPAGGNRTANQGAARLEPASRTRGVSEREETLTLRQAVELALSHSPELAASAEAVRAADGDLRQAGALPNPTLEVEAEEFGGSGVRKGYGAAETTIRLSQTVELGGKRGQRQRVAGSEARLREWDHAARRLDVIASARKAFLDVLHAQGALALADSLLAVAEQVRRAAAERVKAGKVPLLEETRAGVEAADARIARDRAARELDTARRRLAAAWGETSPAFREAAGDLDAVADIPSLATVAAALTNAPEVARWDEQVALAGESLALARAARIPDADISVGITRFEEDGSRAGTAGFTLPLPLFDRNRGGIAAARHEVRRAEHERRAAYLRAMTDLADAHSRLETARAEAQAIGTDLLPGAQRAFEAAQKGYAEGKFGHLDVLDAQRTIGEVKARHLETLAALHKAAADVERIAGAPLNTIQ